MLSGSVRPGVSSGQDPEGLPGEEAMQDEQKKGSDVRFCPYCAQISFDVIGRDEEGYVYCEVCGVDIPIKELIQ